MKYELDSMVCIVPVELIEECYDSAWNDVTEQFKEKYKGKKIRIIANFYDKDTYAKYEIVGDVK